MNVRVTRMSAKTLCLGGGDNAEKLRAISRFGGNIYGQVDSFFEIPRPDGAGRYPEDDAFATSARDALVKKD